MPPLSNYMREIRAQVAAAAATLEKASKDEFVIDAPPDLGQNVLKTIDSIHDSLETAFLKAGLLIECQRLGYFPLLGNHREMPSS